MNKESITLEKIGSSLEKVTERLDKIGGDIRSIGVLMEDMDDKFTLLSEGQEILHEIDALSGGADFCGGGLGSRRGLQKWTQNRKRTNKVKTGSDRGEGDDVT